MPTRNALIFAAVALAAGTGGALVSARVAVGLLEQQAVARVEAALAPEDDWITLSPDGAILILSGEAPSPEAQIETLARIGGAAAGIRIADTTTVAAVREIAAPMPRPASPDLVQEKIIGLHRVEILRNGPLVTLFGEAPEAIMGEGGLASQLGSYTVTDMLAAGPGTPADGWDESLSFALAALERFEQVRITVSPGQVSLSGSVASLEDRQALLEVLAADRPEAVVLETDLSVPRAVIAPFVFRATLAPDTPLEVTGCTAETEAGRDRILAAAIDLGAEPDCALGLGAPSPEWGVAVAAGITALGALGEGTLDIVDQDIALTGPAGMAPGEFNRAVEGLRTALPKVFSLSAALPPPPEPEVVEEAAPPHFIAVRTEDGAVRLRGDVPDEQLGQTAQTLAEAKFGFDTVINETVVRDDLPGGWSARVVGGLEGLGLLQTGQLEITATEVKLTGTTPSDDIQERLRNVLAERLPDTAVALDVWTDEQLLVEPVLAVPAILCAERLTLVLEAAQISFPPGETSIDEASLPIIDRLASILQECPGARFEIGGHTDSQGSENGNMALSQARADAVLAALLERGVDTVFLYARGYGESEPIADNGTEEGRALNRRIAFSLVPGEDEVEADADAEEILQAEGEQTEDTGIETSRGESPTVIVVPAGTDPATVLPEAQAAAEGDAAEGVAAVEESAAEPDPAADDSAPAEAADAEIGEEASAPAAAAPDPDAPPRPMPRPDSVSAGQGN